MQKQARAWMLASRRIGGCGLALLVVFSAPLHAGQVDIPAPPGSGRFGTEVEVLPNGNFVVTAPTASIPAANAGAVYLYSASGELLSALRGATSGDRIGEGGIVVLPDGNFVVISPLWDNGTVVDAGAVTWVSGTAGLTGSVDAGNSLVGSATDDRAGSAGVVPLLDGRYVVASPEWNGGGLDQRGAVTWRSGSSPEPAVIDASNSLVGTTAVERVGDSVHALPNGDYVVASPQWHNGALASAGAVVLADGSSGSAGTITSANALFGTHELDRVGEQIHVLANSAFVVVSPRWDNDTVNSAGAATLVPADTGLVGAVSPANSLVGTTTLDLVGDGGVTTLANGNFVVSSPSWDNGGTANVGAATWVDANIGLVGAVSPSNSLIGASGGDFVGSEDLGTDTGIVALADGNYVVRTYLWDNGAVPDVGAVTWADGDTGLVAVVTAANSTIGVSAEDFLGVPAITALTNGSYVIASNYFDVGALVDAGAATWVAGGGPASGVVSTANSLVGSAPQDYVGTAVIALANGNYVVGSCFWNAGAVGDAGAVTWADGSTGLVGVVSTDNSLVGASPNDRVGSSEVGQGPGLTALPNGDYVARSVRWRNGSVIWAGAVTRLSGSAPTVGVVSPANSLVGTMTFDSVGGSSSPARPGITVLEDGRFVVQSIDWDRGSMGNVGAVTLGVLEAPLVGTITAANSVRGMDLERGSSMTFDYDPVRGRLAVGRPDVNTVSLFTRPYGFFSDGFE